MKILIYTDPHFDAYGGNKHFLASMKSYFDNVIIPKCIETDITTCICAGDFFNSRQSVSLKTLDYVNNDFIPTFERYGIHTFMIAGNHDVAYKNTNTVNSLSIFKRSPNFTVIDKSVSRETLGGREFVFCPWINSENETDVFNSLKDMAADDVTLIGHFEINGAPMYKNASRCENGLNPEILSNFKKVLSGHFHTPSVSSNIEYLGALFHLTWSCVGDWRGFVIYDTETDCYEKVENEYSLFTALSYSDYKDLTGDELYSLCNSQFVKLFIEDEISRVDAETVKYDIEKCSPLKLDIVDLNIFKPTQNAKNVDVSDDIVYLGALDLFDLYVSENANAADEWVDAKALFAEYLEAANAEFRESGGV